MASQITSLTIINSTVYAKRRPKETSKLRVTGLCEGNSPVTGEFPAQMASNGENVSIWWRHHALVSIHFWRSTSAIGLDDEMCLWDSEVVDLKHDPTKFNSLIIGTCPVASARLHILLHPPPKTIHWLLMPIYSTQVCYTFAKFNVPSDKIHWREFINFHPMLYNVNSNGHYAVWPGLHTGIATFQWKQSFTRKQNDMPKCSTALTRNEMSQKIEGSRNALQTASM